MKMKEYDELSNQFSKTKTLTLALYAIVAIATIAILVLPLYNYQIVEDFSINDFDSYEKYLEFIKYLTPEEILLGKKTTIKGVSFITNLKYAFENVSFGWNYVTVIFLIILVIIFALYVLIKMWLSFSAISPSSIDHDKYMRQKYKEILEKNGFTKKKSNDKKKRDNWLNKNGIACFYEWFEMIAIYFVAIIFGNSILPAIFDTESIFKNSILSAYDSLSPYLFICITLIIAVIVLDFLLRKENEKLEAAVLEHNAKIQQKNSKPIENQEPQKNTPAPTKKENSNDMVEQLKKYKDLFDQGFITEEEYEEKRKEIIRL